MAAKWDTVQGVERDRSPALASAASPSLSLSPALISKFAISQDNLARRKTVFGAPGVPGPGGNFGFWGEERRARFRVQVSQCLGSGPGCGQERAWAPCSLSKTFMLH